MIIPNGLKEINEAYGNPDANGDHVLDDFWYVSKTQYFSLPFQMRASWDYSLKINRIRAHELVGDLMIDALKDILDHYGLDYLQEHRQDVLGGAHNFRLMTGSNGLLSTHSWGIAIDINPHMGAFGVKPVMPTHMVQAFKTRGFEWGGDWPSLNSKWPYDGQHFQFATGY